MNNQELKTIWKVTQSLFLSATAFWVLETIIFFVIEGWHLKATNPIEIYLDKIVTDFWTTSAILAGYIFIQMIINLNKNSNGE